MLMIDQRLGGFFLLTGVTFSAFASGFGVCLFDLQQVDACVAAASSWVDTFKGMGDHLIAWAEAIIRAAFHA
mgnify:CR=1 FL=1